MAFLTMQVKCPDPDDYKKLGHIIKYLRGTPDLALTLEGDDAQIVKWWVDASFSVHTDMKSHTGGTLSLGEGSVYSASTRQKLNLKSSTKADELVGVNDMMPLILWTQYFLDAQGYWVRENKVFQDNQSAILLEKNGRPSSSHQTWHINTQYFFVTPDPVKGADRGILSYWPNTCCHVYEALARKYLPFTLNPCRNGS
jgi:hypothetical protein